MEETLFQKYGGTETIRTIVGNFYSDVLESTNLRRFFNKTDMKILMEHQTNFLCFLMGGPNQYTGRNLINAHKNLNITQADFDEVATILKDNLIDASVEQHDIDSIISTVASYADQIITR